MYASALKDFNNKPSMRKILMLLEYMVITENCNSLTINKRNKEYINDEIKNGLEVMGYEVEVGKDFIKINWNNI